MLSIETLGSLKIYKVKNANKFFALSTMPDDFKWTVRHVTGNDQDYLRKIPRVVVQKSALL